MAFSFYLPPLSLCLVFLSTDTHILNSLLAGMFWSHEKQFHSWRSEPPQHLKLHYGTLAGLLCAHRHTHITWHGEALQLMFWSRMWHFIIMAVTCWVPSSYCQWCRKQHITLCNSKSHKAMTGTALSGDTDKIKHVQRKRTSVVAGWRYLIVTHNSKFLQWFKTGLAQRALEQLFRAPQSDLKTAYKRWTHHLCFLGVLEPDVTSKRWCEIQKLEYNNKYQ